MKNIVKLILFTLISINVNCQVTQIVPLGTIDYPNGAYLKDLDNQFLFWLGTWEGVANNKKYTFTFIKFTQHKYEYTNGNYNYEDLVLGKLKVTDLSTNQILYDEASFTDYDDFKIVCRNVNNKVFILVFMILKKTVIIPLRSASLNTIQTLILFIIEILEMMNIITGIALMV